MGGEGKTVEIDETFVGGKEKNKHESKSRHLGTGGAGKEAVFSLVERGGFATHHVPQVSSILDTTAARHSELVIWSERTTRYVVSSGSG